jgi:tRNA (adenine22-N1)-methyltransferase
MTSIKELREYQTHGFNIYDEAIILDSGKYYQIICAEYDGNDHLYNDLELELGKINMRDKKPLFTEYINHLLKKKRRVYDGLRTGGRDLSSTEYEIKEMEALL